MGKPLAMHLHEHRNNLKEGLLEKLKLAQHAKCKFYYIFDNELNTADSD
jgi:hypothetical protein